MSEFHHLIYELLKTEDIDLQARAMRSLYYLLDDYQQYGPKLALLDRDLPPEKCIARLLLDIILTILRPLIALHKLRVEMQEKAHTENSEAVTNQAKETELDIRMAEINGMRMLNCV